MPVFSSSCRGKDHNEIRVNIFSDNLAVKMIVEFLSVIVTGFVLYKIVKTFFWNQSNFWEKYGVREIDTSSAVTKLDLFVGTKTIADADNYAYDQLLSSEKFFGKVELGTPVLHVNDLELIKNVLIKYFEHFADRRRVFAKEDGSLHKMLGSLEGDEWKGVRASVTSTFTSGKIRKMMDIFNNVGEVWVEEFTRKANENPNGSVNIDVLRDVNLYTIEVISTAVFGMSANIIKYPNSDFCKFANEISDLSKFQMMKLAFRINFPRLSKLLGFSIINRKALTYFEKVFSYALKSRMKGETEKRNDFLQLLVEAKKGDLKEEACRDEEMNSFERDAQISTASLKNKKDYLTDEIMNGQSVIFFIGGYNTTSNCVVFALYSLALHSHIQDKLRAELEKIVEEDGSFGYDELGHHVYLDMVVCEVLRKFPVITRLERLCIKEYNDPKIGLVIPKEAIAAIPLERLHNDKRFYEYPDQFYPEHFVPEKKAARTPYAWMPFGTGPRNCIGMRFAMIQIKSILARIVTSFKIEITARTPVPLQFKIVGLQIIPPKHLELRLTPIPGNE